jgi:hypothetical protein
MFSELFGGKMKVDSDSGPVAPAKRVAEVGWLLDPEKSGFIWEAPKPFRHDHLEATNAKSVTKCPAVVDIDARHFVVPCPFDLHLKLAQDAKGNLTLQNTAGAQSSVRQSSLEKMVAMHPQSEWRHPERFLMQIATPYVFVTDDDVWINLLPPFLDYGASAWPGVIVGGRFALKDWPRKMMWAFEWHDLGRDLILKRGQPWFMVRFEPPHPSMQVRLVEAEMHPDLHSHMDQMVDVSNYVNQTSKLFKVAAERRPKTLLRRNARCKGEAHSNEE